jgi:hypothetical protein
MPAAKIAGASVATRCSAGSTSRTASDHLRLWSELGQINAKQEPILVKLLYMLTFSFGWGYLGSKFNWPLTVTSVAIVMTITFAFYLSRVIEDDRK